MSSQALNLKSSTTLDLNLDVFTDLVATRCRLRRIYKKKKFQGGPSSPTYLQQKEAHFALAIFSPYLTSPYNTVTQGNTMDVNLPDSTPGAGWSLTSWAGCLFLCLFVFSFVCLLSFPVACLVTTQRWSTTWAGWEGDVPPPPHPYYPSTINFYYYYQW